MHLPFLRAHLTLRNSAIVVAMAQAGFLVSNGPSTWPVIAIAVITALFLPTAILPLLSKQHPARPGLVATLNCVLAAAVLIFLATAFSHEGYALIPPINALFALAVVLYPPHGWVLLSRRT
jgi:hypothetical protein